MRPSHVSWSSAVLAVLLAGTPFPALAASHREGPFVAGRPRVDGSDLYLFRSYEVGRAGYVTLIADYQPDQDPSGGPTFFPLDPEALYEVHIDNNGDAREDLTFRFRFQSPLAGGQGLALHVFDRMVHVPLLNIAPLSSGDESGLNVIESYSVQLILGDRRNIPAGNLTNVVAGGSTFRKPADHIGDKTFGADFAYENYARTYIYDVNVPGCAQPGRVFVGQRREPFAVNAGGLFDLLNIPISVLFGPPDAGLDSLYRKNVTSLALELPTACVTGPGPVIGAWTTAHVRGVRPRRLVERWMQVSRVSAPLVNALFIGLKDKDRFNGSRPAYDAQFTDYVTHPTLPALMETVYGGAGVVAPTAFPRNDLAAVFLTGLPGVNASGAAAEILRLNTALPATPQANQNWIGLLGCYDPGGVLDLTNPTCDPAGFPNGRRPGDDVVDIVLRLAMGYLLPGSQAPVGQLPFGDGAYKGPLSFDAVFPYLRAPIPGGP
jgi:hypothetical protein